MAFAVISFLSSQTGEALCLFNNVSQSVSQSGEDRQLCVFVKFWFLLYRRSRVFLWLATADMASL